MANRTLSLCRANNGLITRWSTSQAFTPKAKPVPRPIQLPHSARSVQSMSTEPKTGTSASSTDYVKSNGNGNGNESAKKKAEELKKDKEERAKNFLHKVMAENKKWCAEHGFDDFVDVTEYSFLDKQTPVGTVLSCCDSRAPTAALGNDAPNEIFSIRNIGNQFANSIGSFRYGVEVLQTPYAIILGHTNCGAIRAAATDYRFLHTMVQQEVIPLVRVIRFADSLANAARIDEMHFDHRCSYVLR